MICPRCSTQIVRTEEKPEPGELRRVTWTCKCVRAPGVLGTLVEWAPKTVPLRRIAR